MTDEPRYPMRPLVEHLGGFRNTVQKFHWSGNTYRRHVNYGLTAVEADRLAVLAGVHPSALWPQWWDDWLTVNDDVFIHGGGWRHAWEWEHRRTA